MINFLICLFISIILSFGMSILLVEKGNDFPIKRYRVKLQLLLSKIHHKASQVLLCSTCSSFWLTFFSDCVVCILSLILGGFYFFWPFSGIIVAGFVWFVIEYLNALDSKGD